MSEQTHFPPDLTQVLKEFKNEIFANLNCVQIGKIQKVNDNQTVEINLQVKRTLVNGTISDYPLLVDCPYFVLSGGGAYIDMPIKKGDPCLVLFNDRNIDNWWSTENVTEPADRRKHNLSDGIALVGISSNVDFLDNDGTWLRILGTSGAGSEEVAARKEDPVLINNITDSIFITWIATISAAVNALAPGSVPIVPTTATGKISGGSSEVKIG